MAAINNNLPSIIRNDLFIPNHNNERQIAIAERQISYIDRQIAGNNKTISITKELIDNHNKIIEATKESIEAIKESRVILQSSRDTGQKIVDITEKLINCYEKLLEIRRAKNSSNVVDMKQVAPLNITSNPIVVKDNVIPMDHVKNVDIKSINATATRELGNILYDKYKDINQPIALNIRTKFFETLNYNPSNHVFSANSNVSHLETIFTTFSNYLKSGEYNYLKNDKDYFNDLQSKLISLDKHC